MDERKTNFREHLYAVFYFDFQIINGSIIFKFFSV